MIFLLSDSFGGPTSSGVWDTWSMGTVGCRVVGELCEVHKGSFTQWMDGKALLPSAPKGFSPWCYPRTRQESKQPSGKACTLLDNKMVLAITAALLSPKVKNLLLHYSNSNLCSISVILWLPPFVFSYLRLHHYKHLCEHRVAQGVADRASPWDLHPQEAQLPHPHQGADWQRAASTGADFRKKCSGFCP